MTPKTGPPAPWRERLRLLPQAARRGLRCRLRHDLYYLVEGQDWVIKREGQGILAVLAREQPQLVSHLTTSPRWLKDQLIHFGSLGCLAAGLAYTHPRNRVAATVYHGYQGMDQGMQKRLDAFRRGLPRLDAVITACNIMRRRLLAWGVPADKLHLIPLGTSVTRFHPYPPQRRQELRRRLGIPPEAVCIGSFQKDGNGWGEGLEPKLIKGPDILVQVLARLRRHYPVFALLTGPARGYVKKGLEAAGVPYRHQFLKDFSQLPDYYNCLDLYLATAREEGGPKCLPESMACGVPLVTTKTGMAPDMVVSGRNGFVTEVEDVEGLVEACARIIADPGLARALVARGLETVRDYDLSVLARAHYRLVYQPLLASL